MTHGPEFKVKTKINKALAALPECYRFCPVQNGMGAPGLDYFCCIAGRFVAIEAKVPGKHMTPRQEVTAAVIRAAGGLVFEIHDDADIAAMLANLWLMIEFDREHSFVAETPSVSRAAPAGRRDDVP